MCSINKLFQEQIGRLLQEKDVCSGVLICDRLISLFQKKIVNGKCTKMRLAEGLYAWNRWKADMRRGEGRGREGVEGKRIAINCSKFTGKDEWPPNSPDVNVLDYHSGELCLNTTRHFISSQRTLIE